MTAIRDIIAKINMAMSGFFLDYGGLAAAIICILIAAVFLFMLYRAQKCSMRKKPRYKYKAPNSLLAEATAQNLAQAISFETVTGNIDKIQEFHKYLQQKYPLVFSQAEVDVINGGSLLIRFKGKNSELPAMLFAAHMDVVPADGEWSVQPFAETVKDDKVYGRGAIDCKNVLISLLTAAEYLLKQEFKPERDIYFAFGHDEEEGGQGGAAIISRLLAKRGVNVGMVLDEGGCVINGYMGSRNAAACVYVSEKCKCDIQITANCEGGHASEPGRHTAIGILSEAICRIEADRGKKKMMPITCEYFKKSAGFMTFGKRFLCANLPFTKYAAAAALSKNPASNAMLRSTAAATVISGGKIKNALPESACVNFDLRILPGVSVKKLIGHYEKLLADLPCSIEITFQSEPSAVSDYNGKPFSILSDAITERFGHIPIIPAVMNGGSDSRYYEDICPCVYRFMPFVLTPSQLGAMHGNDECIPVNSLGAGVEFYMDFIKKTGSCNEF